MIKLKYKDIKEVYDFEQYLDEQDKENANYLKTHDVVVNAYGYYTPSQANWSYYVGLVNVNGRDYKVVTVFGQVKAVQYFNITKYNY